MNQNVHADISIFSLLFIAIPLVLLLALFYRRYLGLKREGGYLLAVGTLIASVAAGIYKANQLDDSEMPDWKIAVTVFSAGFLVLTAVPLVIKLYRGWIGGHVTEAEKSTGAAGIRAWLSPASLVLALLVSICAENGFGYSFLSVLALTILALLAYPVLMTLTRPEPSPAPVERAENLTAEREKVLSLLEAGKISAEESAELLNALGTTLKAPAPKAHVLAPEHRTMLIGAGLVLVGFFLPWFTINLGKVPMLPPGANGIFNLHTESINLSGGDVEHGLGWLILLLSIGTAVLPLVATELDSQTRRTASMVALGVGARLILYIINGQLRVLNVGIILAGAGYFLQWVCLLKPRTTSHPVPAVVGEHA
jgi:hypothetical protein